MPVVRAIGRGVLNIADALGGLLGEALLRPGEPEPELALRYATEARRIVEDDSLHLVHLVAAALADRIRSHALAVEESERGAAARRAGGHRLLRRPRRASPTSARR